MIMLHQFCAEKSACILELLQVFLPVLLVKVISFLSNAQWQSYFRNMLDGPSCRLIQMIQTMFFLHPVTDNIWPGSEMSF